MRGFLGKGWLLDAVGICAQHVPGFGESHITVGYWLSEHTDTRKQHFVSMQCLTKGFLSPTNLQQKSIKNAQIHFHRAGTWVSSEFMEETNSNRPRCCEGNENNGLSPYSLDDRVRE